jgi:hypothetical protein
MDINALYARCLGCTQQDGFRHHQSTMIERAAGRQCLASLRHRGFSNMAFEVPGCGQCDSDVMHANGAASGTTLMLEAWAPNKSPTCFLVDLYNAYWICRL